VPGCPEIIKRHGFLADEIKAISLKTPSAILQFQVLLFDPDRMFPRLFANDMTNVNSRERKWDAFEGLNSRNHE
jgi:hypothetical protein